MPTARVLIAEDEAIVAMNMELRLQSLGYEVLATVDTGEAAVQQAAALQPDLVLMDIRLAGAMDGISAATAIRAQLDLPVVYLTAHTDETTVQQATNSGPYGYVVKPFDIRELHITMVLALYKHLQDREQRLREFWLATMLHTIDEAVIATDVTGNVTYLNQAAEALTGWQRELALGQPIEQVLPPSDDQEQVSLHSVLRSGATHQEATSTIRRRDGQPLQIDQSTMLIRNSQGQPLGALIVFQRAVPGGSMQALVSEQRKLEALAEMASGVAHEFSDMLTVILGGSSMALDNLPQQSALRPFITLIDTAARRAVALTQQLFAYSGQGRMLVQPLRLNQLVADVVAHTSVPLDIKIRQQLDPQLPLLFADTVQIRQVIDTLVANAIEAIGTAEGTVMISSALRTLSRDDVAATYMAPDLPAGKYVALIVTDDGSGMSADVVARVFEPFFTTKLTGRGLGLAVALGIIKSHKALIQITSSPGQGTSVVVLLPCIAYPL